MAMNILLYFDYLGTFVFALSGVWVAAGKKMDPFGALVLAFVTAVGGGTTRDLFLGRQPVFWMREPVYLYIILIALVTGIAGLSLLRRLSRPLLVLDALGLGVFTVIGFQVATNEAVSPLLAVLSGTVTAVMGGVFRDTLANQVPVIFQQDIYASACILGGALYYALAYLLPAPDYLAPGLAAMTVFLVRLAAIRFGWSLPRLRRPGD